MCLLLFLWVPFHVPSLAEGLLAHHWAFFLQDIGPLGLGSPMGVRHSTDDHASREGLGSTRSAGQAVPLDEGLWATLLGQSGQRS